ncbi:MAG: DNA-directed RNA polymerase subunit alpha [Campylobacterales bacterium]
MNKIKTTPYIPTDMSINRIDDKKVEVTVFPFESGYGITLAHPLRRLLLTSSIGYAPVGVKIEGASHEFDSIRGVMEDVALFIVNLKNIRFKIKDESEEVRVEYEFSGPKTIVGEDLNNDMIEVVTKDTHLASLNEDGNLKFTLIINKGIGYTPSEDVRASLESDFIPLDAYFTPVRKAVYEIDNVLVEDDPSYEKVIFEIITDGQLDPVDALKNALSTMYKQLSVFNAELEFEERVTPSSESSFPAEHSKLISKIDTLELSARSFNCLDRANIKYVGELVLMSENELKDIKNLGAKSSQEIKDKLEEIGYPVGSELADDLATKLKKKIEKNKE